MPVNVTRIPRPRGPRLVNPTAAPATKPPPLTGAWAPLDLALDDPLILPLPGGSGPEDVAVDADGRVYSGAEDGRIWCWPADAGPGTAPRLVADTGGRPLGIEVDRRDGTLIVCDAYRGLLRITDGAVADLTSSVDGHPIGLCNNASIAADGTVYFTDSSTRFPLSAWKKDILEQRPNGRLLRYDPADRSTAIVADGLYFPNGVALTPDESAVLVVETSAHRMVRIPATGGSASAVCDLPAYPDNMSAVGDGTYWIGLPSPRNRQLERLLPYPRLRRAVALLPEAVQPKPARYGLVALVDGAGRVRRTIHGPAGRYTMITGVRQHDGILWLGSLTEGGVARIAL
jgi:sugar lactone lactonase YvrE